MTLLPGTPLAQAAEKAMTLRAPGKVNFYLRVLDRRPDGYHQILTVMQLVDLWDELILEPGDGIRLQCPGAGVPEGPENLVWKAAHLLMERANARHGVTITLRKGIPVAAGMGGGSSDAATILYGLNRFWGTGFSREDLIEMGRSLGSDVPFFLSGAAGIAWGRGDEIEPLQPLETPWLLLINPGYPVSTAWAYDQVHLSRLSRQPADQNFAVPEVSSRRVLKFGLTKGATHNKIPPHKALQVCDDTLWVSLQNDLMAGVVSHHPEVGQILKVLQSRGSRGTVMSGSGPTVLGIFEDRQSAQTAADGFSQFGWQTWIVQCLNQNPMID